MVNLLYTSRGYVILLCLKSCKLLYANERETRALFDRYAHCTEDFCSRLEQGCSFPDLVKAV